MKLRKILALVLAAMLFVSIAAACADNGGGGGAGGDVTIEFMLWGGGAGSPDPIDQLWQRAVDEFNELDNGITVEIQWTADYYTRLPVVMAAGNVADIFAIHASGNLKMYTDPGKVHPLNQYLEADTAWRDSFIDEAFKLLTFYGNIYAMPTYFAAVPLFYNTEIFAEHGLTPPTTYAELKEVVAVLREAGVTPMAFGARDAWTPALFMAMVANRLGGDGPFDTLMEGGGGGGTWLHPSYIEAGRIMQELADIGAFPDDFMGLGADDMAAMVKAGNAAMYVMGSWAIQQFYADDSTVQGKMNAAPFPSFPGGTGNPDTWLGQPSQNFAIAQVSQNPESAVEFLKWLVQEDYQIFLGENAGQIPATRVVLNPDLVRPVALRLNELLATSAGMFIFYDVGLGRTIGDEFNNAVQTILGGADVTQVLTNLQTFTEETWRNLEE